MSSILNQRKQQSRTKVDMPSTAREAGLVNTRREMATEREYRRRQRLNRAFSALATCIPPRFLGKGTKFEVLCGAISYIDELVDFIVQHHVTSTLIQEWTPAGQEGASQGEVREDGNQRQHSKGTL
ncbi:uncharacterized protein LOC119742667 isoform X2 [Patiria miniata]|uniref:BHLH domain-containing protein n=1 Tax=Patiria miniata TaxID=46514 RepID=A0A914BFP5_PATMI|nr:uncharacterized protein LOC119742667 isoform X2 [Patiria miniata]